MIYPKIEFKPLRIIQPVLDIPIPDPGYWIEDMANNGRQFPAVINLKENQ